MNLNDYFKSENKDLIFDEKSFRSEFIAEVNDNFTEYMDAEVFTRDWAFQFPSQRYVIVVFQRHSIYKSCQQVYKNEGFREIVGESRYKKPVYVLMLDKEQLYTVPTWKRPLRSYFVRSEKNPLQLLTFENIDKAEKEAMKYSKSGYKVAVLAWYADFDMY